MDEDNGQSANPQQLLDTQVPPTSQSVSQPPPVISNQPPRPVAPASAIYPEPTVDIRTSSAPVSADTPSELVATNGKQARKIIAVRVVTAVLIVINAINAYNWYRGQHSGYASLFNAIGIGVGLALAIGIFLLNETARLIYVLLSVLMLVFMGIGLIGLWTSTNHSSSNITNTRLTKSMLEKSIAEAQKNPTLTPALRQKLIQTLQREVVTAPSDSGSVSPSVQQFFSYGPLFVSSVLPLIFLTRPSVKEAFK